MPTTRTKSTTAGPTREDAQLLVQLLSTTLAEQAADGMDLLFGYDQPPSYEQFVKDHPRGSDGARAVNSVLRLHETVGTFVKNGLLDAGLVHDLMWVQGAWDRCKDIALHYRYESGEPRIYENFEALAAGARQD